MASLDRRLAPNKVKRMREDPGISSFNQHRLSNDDVQPLSGH